MKSEDGKKGQNQEPDQEEFEELDFEELDFEEREEDNWQDEDDPEEDGEVLSPWMKTALFLGLVVLAAIICALLWHFTHPGRPEDGSRDIRTEEGGEEQSGTERSPDPAGDPEQSREPAGDPEQSLDPAEASGAEEPSGGSGGPGSDPDAASSPESGSRTPESSEAGPAENSDSRIQEPVQGTDSMEFTAVQESVTPKDVVNLRSVPTTLDDGNIVTQSQNGEVLSRVGVNKDTGWSEIEYEGQTVYAVTQYLTTDLNYKTPVQPSDPNRVSTVGGRVIIFANCDDWISPKEYVNLRTEPSTSEGDATVNCQLNQGEKAHRTGYSADSGWSRVEYNGQVLYVVTSLVQTVTEE